MRVSLPTTLISAAALLAIATTAAAQQPAPLQPAGETPQHSPQGQTEQPKAPEPPQGSGGSFAAGTLSDGTKVSNRQTPQRLQFTDAQRAQIRAAVDKRSAEVDFPLSTADAAKSFQPKIGAGVPTSMEGQTLPVSLTDQIPALKDYVYLKLPDQAMIMDPMSRKVAEIVTLP